MNFIQNCSVTIITHNEEKNISKCLSKMTLFPEVVVVDSYSNDRTFELCKNFANVKFFRRKFKNYSNQKNWAAYKAKNDWVLNIDADEIITNKLIKELSKKQYDDSVCYLIPEIEYMYGKIIKHSGYYRCFHTRFYNKNYYHFKDKVHEKIVNISGKENKYLNLNSEILHYSHLKISDTIEGYNKYTEFEVDNLRLKYKRHGLCFIVAGMIYEYNKQFWGRLIYKRGYLDGIHGLVIALLRSTYVVIAYSKYLINRFG